MKWPKLGKPPAKEKFYRTAVKAVTWRIIGSLSLIITTYFFTGKFDLSITLGLIDIFSNLLLYIIHERLWEKTSWGRSFFNLVTIEDSPLRSFAKAITWRLLATTYLMIISWLITGKPILSIALSIIDALLNIIEYYIHERIWNAVKWGK